MPARRLRRVLAGVAAAVLAASQALAAPTIIRDAEIERALAMLARPILLAAGLPARGFRVILVRDREMNAFVVDARHVFIHTGLMRRLRGRDELQAVIAHEIAHIANGHIARRTLEARSGSGLAGLGILLGAAVGVASGNAGAGAGAAIGASESARRSLLAHSRAEEASADRASLAYLVRAGVDPRAAARVLDIFSGQEALGRGRQDPYVRSHPLTRDRIRAVHAFAEANRQPTRADPELDYWYARARTKLDAWLSRPGAVLRHHPAGRASELDHLARAVACHRMPDVACARREVDTLMRLRPGDPYYLDLRGQILLESGDVAGAVTTLRRALVLAPQEAQIAAALARALLARKDRAGAREARRLLEAARARDPFDPRLLHDLALANARLGQPGAAAAASAEHYALLGRLHDAGRQAERALALAPRGSPAWLRAQDVLAAARRAGYRPRDRNR